MGFLDHSTNNVIIDAVLTDEGRRLLAQNDGRFSIDLFSLGDDEVDYRLITRFGRAVGKEKISKNTPIFEAQTRKELAIKNRLLTLPEQTVDTLPVVSVGEDSQGYDTASNTLSFDESHRTRTLRLSQTITGATSVPEGTADSSFTIMLPDRFLVLDNASSGYLSLTPNSRIATYRIASSDRNEQRGSRIALTITARNNLDNTVYSIFGTPPNRNVIESSITVIGDQSGIRKDINVQIYQNAAS